MLEFEKGIRLAGPAEDPVLVDNVVVDFGEEVAGLEAFAGVVD